MKNLGSVKFTLIISIMSVGILSGVASGIAQYVTQASSSRDEIIHINEAVMQSVVSLASRGVDGGNKMILSNKEATSLYEASKIKYMKISGTSAGSGKTEFSEAIPPQAMEYEFTAKDADAKFKSAVLSGKKGLIDKDLLFVVSLPLMTKNGAEVTAVFSAEQLRGLEWRVARGVGVVTLGILLVAFVLANMIGRRVAGPIENISQQINEITKNSDLTARVKTSNQHEIGQIASSFNSLIDNLQQLMRDITGSAENVLETASQLSDTSSRISTGSTQQRERSVETASAVEELSLSIGRAADNANKANETSSETSHTASRGEEITRNTTNEMQKISEAVKSTTQQVMELDESSREIGGIISMIKDIADQTNLLALNAAIEAARAGEQGRGFAVVADEVRKLAASTTLATTEIASKIDSSRNKTVSTVASMQKSVMLVENGVLLANQAGDALAKINEGAQYTASMINGIAAATKEQSTAATEIAQHIGAIAQTATEYEAIATETRSTTKNLEQLAGSLKAMASRFKV